MTQRILAVQLADIGDLVLTVPALRTLRERLPDAQITLLTTPHAAPILPAEVVDRVFTFEKHAFDRPTALIQPRNLRKLMGLWRDLDRGVFDTVIFFHHFSTGFGVLKFVGMAAASGAHTRIGLRSAKTPFLNVGIPEQGFGARHQADYWLALVDTIADGGEGEQSGSIPREDRAIGGRLRVAIHAGSGGYSTARRWEPERFAHVAAHLQRKHNAEIVFVGGANDDTPQVIAHLPDDVAVTDRTGQTTLPELSSLLAECDLFIGADSGVMHIAALNRVPVVAVFGPSNHAAWHPYQTRHVVVRSAPPCSPCSYVGTGVGLREGCAARTCMRMVTADDVIGAAEQLLTSATPHPEPPAPAPPTVEAVQILGVPVHKLTVATWLDQIAVWIAARDGVHQMCTVNPEFIVMAGNDPNFYNILNRADLCLADGIGVIWAARYIGERLPERVTGSDGVPHIAERAAREGWRLFLLGAWDDIAEQAADVLRQRYPGVQIVGTYSGSPRPEDEDAIVERVNATNADVLLVAYGAPQQDKWIARNAPRLKVSVAMGVGGTFDYLAGIVPMAPAWMRSAGLEWLFRLIRQPHRIRRQLRLPIFVIRVLLAGRRRAA